MQIENKDIRTTTAIKEIVQCINDDKYGGAPLIFINFFNSLPDKPYYNYLRTISVPYLFNSFEKNLRSEEEANKWFKGALMNLRNNTENLLEGSHFYSIMKSVIRENPTNQEKEEVKAHTGRHYGNLFKEFDNKSYFEEAKQLLEIRLKRNNIKIPDLERLKVLDQGCGGGRYTCAWKLLGAEEVTGLDYSESAIEDARKRVEIAGLNGVNFQQGSVLEMPFEDKSFDIVFSNGVLHHTENWQKGISEQLRVLKPGGYGWLYLIENPGGIFWDKIEILRAIMKNVDKGFAQKILKSMNIPDNRIFYMLDHVMVPINTRLTPEQIDTELKNNQACSIQRLTRGTDFDRIEQIHKKIPYAKEKFGVGENRYFFRKEL